MLCGAQCTPLSIHTHGPSEPLLDAIHTTITSTTIARSARTVHRRRHRTASRRTPVRRTAPRHSLVSRCHEINYAATHTATATANTHSDRAKPGGYYSFPRRGVCAARGVCTAHRRSSGSSVPGDCGCPMSKSSRRGGRVSSQDSHPFHITGRHTRALPYIHAPDNIS